VKPVKPAVRKYTGTTDGVGTGERKGLTVLIKYLSEQSDGALWNNGSFGVRNMRGKESLSVHATGRAVDMSYRKMETKGKANGRKYALRAMEFLVTHANAIGLEMIIDYYPAPFGRAWRCDRNAWQNYDKKTVSGAPSGDWFHVEISPEMANAPARMQEILSKLTYPQPDDFGLSS
jgi:hypothetical protein